MEVLKGITLVGYLSDNGKVYKRKVNADKANEIREKNRLENRAAKKGWRVSSL